MKLSKEERIQILDQCAKLERNCRKCQIRLEMTSKKATAKEIDTYCKTKCETGLELQHLGRKILNPKDKEQIPQKTGGAAPLARMTKVEKEQMHSKIKEMRASGSTWKAIAESVGVAVPTLYRWKNKSLI